MSGTIPAPRREAYETQEILLPRRSTSRVDKPAAKPRDRVGYAVGAAALVLAVAATVHFALAHETLGFHDAYSHLEISRRVVASRTTGLAQLGTIWLPLPHLLQALFAWNFTLYATGLAGSIVSGAAYVAGTVLIYRIVVELCDGRRAPGVVGAAVFATNANLLFLQTTAMDELPFYAFTLAALYQLTRWATTHKATHLLSAAVANMMAMLCRYEAWALSAVLAVCVILMARQQGHSWRDIRGLAAVWITFGAALAGIAWPVYNWMVTGNLLNFINGPDSSKAQMARRAGDVEVGSWSKSLHAYVQTIISNLGFAVIALAFAGLIVLLVRERLAARALPTLALISVLPFYVYSLESGQEPIGIPPVNGDLLNVRYGLIALLPAAILIGFLSDRIPTRIRGAAFATSAIAVAALAGMTAYTYSNHQVVLIRESLNEEGSQEFQIEAGTYVLKHTTGPVLVNLVGNERVAFRNLDRVIYEGTKEGSRNVWKEALVDPRAVGAKVVVMRNSATRGVDQVYYFLGGWPGLSAYHVVFRNPEYTIYALN
ncbi:MAG: hypothetical protein HOV83_27810 [Catenulispora sp.]|nr:hypothetical protein [Catenulispora sp.]